MKYFRLFMLVAVCAVCGRTAWADTMKEETPSSNMDETDKPKRELNIIGPVPTSYRGQATGQTTFDGILADDLQLPDRDFRQFSTQNPARPPTTQFDQSQGQRSESGSPTARFEQFQAESPDEYNFEGDEELTYDGVVASDLMLPYPRFTYINQGQESRSAQQPPQHYSFRLRVPQTVQQPLVQVQAQPVARQADFNDGFRSNRFVTFQQGGNIPANTDLSQFQTETPTERYNRLQQEYLAALADYRRSLLRFQEQLRKYSSLGKKK